MNEDVELLRRYAGGHAEDAFAALVERHLKLVYSAALRQVGGDTHLAKDVTQAVFTDLARKSASLTGRTVLTGWLYTSTRYAYTALHDRWRVDSFSVNRVDLTKSPRPTALRKPAGP